MIKYGILYTNNLNIMEASRDALDEPEVLHAHRESGGARRDGAVPREPHGLGRL